MSFRFLGFAPRRSVLLPLIVVAAVGALPAQSSQFAARVVAASHPGGQSFGLQGLALGGPRGSASASGSLHVWSLGSAAAANGSIQVGFDGVIQNRAGADFIVFENAFYSPGNQTANVFGELMWVEVSSDGATFARFPGQCTVPAPIFGLLPIPRAAVSGFAGADPTAANMYANPLLPDPFLAGDPLVDPDAAGGTAFDLQALAGDPLVSGGAVDLNAIRHVRLVDVRGDGSTLDSFGNPIYDVTDDDVSAELDAIAVIHLAEDGDSDWPQPGRGAAAGGRVFARLGAAGVPAARWTSPGVALDPRAGVIVLGTVPPVAVGVSVDVANARVRAVGINAATGDMLWQGPYLATTAALAPLPELPGPAGDTDSATIYLATEAGLQALDAATGAARWPVAATLTAGGGVAPGLFACRIAAGRVVVFLPGDGATRAGRLEVLDAATGAPVWQATLPVTAIVPPIIDAPPGDVPNVIVVEGPTGPVRAFTLTTGALSWLSTAAVAPGQSWSPLAGDRLLGAPSVADGALFLHAAGPPASATGRLYAVNAFTGGRLWEVAAPAGASRPVRIAARVFVAGTETGSLVVEAFATRTGTSDWQRTLGAVAAGVPASVVGLDDALLVAVGGTLHALDPATGADLTGSGAAVGPGPLAVAGPVHLFHAGGSGALTALGTAAWTLPSAARNWELYR